MKSKDFLKDLAALSATLRANIEAHYAGWDDSASAIAARIKAVNDPVSGFEYFVTHYSRTTSAIPTNPTCTATSLSGCRASSPHQGVSWTALLRHGARQNPLLSPSSTPSTALLPGKSATSCW